MLEFATEGCCKGHKCDNCKTCKQGRCCRKDNPHYRLPELGEWNGPIYGEIGMLYSDGVNVECHCCGAWFGHLGNHVLLAHNLTADEYKAIFGLAAATGLIGPRLAAQRVESIQQHKLWTMSDPGQLAAITPEQRSAMSSRKRRPETVRRMREAMRKKFPPRVPKVRNLASPYRGVTRHGTAWRARISYQGAMLFLGDFHTDTDAARAYDAKARELYGDDARLNFPDGR